jgi:putative heme transporter
MPGAPTPPLPDDGGDSSDPRPPEQRRSGNPHRRTILIVLSGVAIAGLVYFVIPQIAGLGPTLRRLRAGDVWWLALGVVLEVVSIAGEVVLFRGVFSHPGSPIGWKISGEITLAGAAATKLLATAGAGGIALTVWALGAAGLPSAEIAGGMVCYEILTYGVYMAALAIGGFGLWTGLFSGRAPVGVTLVPALFGTTVIVVVVSMLFVAGPAERYLRRRAEASKGRVQRWQRRAAALPRSLQAGLRAALAMVRRRDPSTLGAIIAWGFDIGALWASFRAFGHAPPAAVLVMGYYVGTLANTLPLPGGIGGVEGGMIGSFVAFGVDGSLAVLAVLAYRTISYWLPTIPGAIAYFRLRRQVADWRSGDSPADPPRRSGGYEKAAPSRAA